jgi:hypothetical protein
MEQQRLKPKVSLNSQAESVNFSKEIGTTTSSSENKKNFVQKLKAAFVSKPAGKYDGHRMQRSNSSPVSPFELSNEIKEDNSKTLLPINEFKLLEQSVSKDDLSFNLQSPNYLGVKSRSNSSPVKPNTSLLRFRTNENEKVFQAAKTLPQMQYAEFAQNLPHRLNDVKEEMINGLFVYQCFISSVERFAEIQKKCADDCLKVMYEFNEKIEKNNLEKHKSLKKYYSKSIELFMGVSGSQLNFVDCIRDEMIIPLSRNMQIFEQKKHEILTRSDVLKNEYHAAEEKIQKGREDFFRMWQEYNENSVQRNEKLLASKDDKKIRKFANQITSQRERLKSECVSLESLIAYKQFYWNVDVPEMLSDMEEVERSKLESLQNYHSTLPKIWNEFSQFMENSLARFTSDNLFDSEDCIKEFVSNQIMTYGPPPKYFTTPKSGLPVSSKALEKMSSEEEHLYSVLGDSEAQVMSKDDEFFEKAKKAQIVCVKAKFSYSAPENCAHENLSFYEGDVIRVTNDGNSEWSYGYVTNDRRGFEGWFPKKYVSSLENVKYGMNLEHVLEIPIGVLLFEKFLKREFSDENLYFWIAASTFEYLYHKLPPQQILSKASDLIRVFVDNQASKQINIIGKTRAAILNFQKNNIETKISENSAEKIKPDFSQLYSIIKIAQDEVFEMMSKDSFVRFKKSDLFLELINNLYPES